MSENQHTILVVDPDARSYKTFESVLGAHNSVLFVPNVKTAIDFPNSQPVDMVFISHVINGTDGITLLESFKKRYPSIPIILIAEQPKVDDVISAYRSGAREVILKPLDADELAEITQKISGFVSAKISKRRWFLPVKKKTRTKDFEKNNGTSQNPVFNDGTHINSVSVVEFENSPKKESTSMAEVVNNQLIYDAPLQIAQLDAETHITSQKDLVHPLLEAFFFGPFRVHVNNKPIENWPSKKGKSLFAYLLLNYKKKIYRDVLMDLFWPKSCPDSARNCLNVTIHGIRRILEEVDNQSDYILFRDECYYFNSDIKIIADVEKFRETWRNAERIEHTKGIQEALSEYERAAVIYTGDFIEDERYSTWSLIDRENLKEMYLVILEKLSINHMMAENYSEAIRLAELILAKDNCREEIYFRLMESLYKAGQRGRAMKVYQKCVRTLKAELDVKPAPDTVELYAKIKQSKL